MKVNGNGTGVELLSYLKQIQQQQNKAAGGKSANAGQNVHSGPGTDRVDLSDAAREVQQAFNTLREMPEVRTSKVAQVKMDVEKGTYQVVGARIASEMLRESFENNLLLQNLE